MKILHFYRTYFPDTQGGLEEAIRQICASTKTLGVESRILTLSQNPEPRVIHFPEADVYRAKLDLDIASCSMGREAFQMFRELEQWADIIHYHFPWPFADLVKLISKSKKPSVLTYHSDIVRQRWLAKLYEPLMRTFLRGITKIVATSPNYVETSPILSSYREKTTAIPIGLNMESYPPVNYQLTKEIITKYGENFFLFIGVMRKYKGLHILLEAMKGAPFSVLIAGQGPQQSSLKDLAGQLGLTNVHFLGHVSNEAKIALLHCCRALVLPSHQRSEAFGVSLLEAAMMGKPLVTSEIGTGTSYVNIHNETGLICIPSNVTALQEALYKIYTDDEMVNRMGDNAKSRFNQLFTATKMGTAYAKLYEDILKQG